MLTGAGSDPASGALRDPLPVAVLVAASVMWGLTWWPLKALNQMGVAGVPLAVIAFGAVSVVLVPMLWAERRRWAGRGRSLLLIMLFGGYANLAFTTAMIYGEVIRVMVLFYLLPVWGVLGGRVFLGERIDGPRWVGVGLALGGAFLILGGFQVFGGSVSWMDVLAVTCGMAFALNNIFFRAEQTIPVTSKVAAMLFGCFVIALILTGFHVQPWPQVSPAAWGWVALYGLAWLLVATVGTQWGVTHMEAGRASIIIIMELLTAVVSAALIAGERMSPPEMIGGALILAAAFIEARRAG
jgi:drug/metabolite transporter (DMT)-like permease